MTWVSDLVPQSNRLGITWFEDLSTIPSFPLRGGREHEAFQSRDSKYLVKLYGLFRSIYQAFIPK
jgi:hypothetical protein